MRALTLLLCLLLPACGDDDPEPGLDAGADANPDAAGDAGLDASVDAGPDAELVDAGADASVPAQLTFSKQGAGTISIEGVGLACGERCSLELPAGSTVTLNAVPAAGGLIAAWTGPCVGSSEICSFVLAADTTVSVQFAAAGVAVDFAVVGPEAGSIDDGQGLACAGSCVKSYPAGSTVSVSPVASSVPFHGFSGLCEGPTCSFVAGVAGTVRAVFGHLALVGKLSIGSGQTSDRIAAMRVGPDGDVYLVGEHGGPLDFAGIAVPAAGKRDILVARLDGQTGTPRWVKSFGGTADDVGAGIAVTGDRVFVSAAFDSKIDFGLGAIDLDNTSAAILALDLDGTVVWQRIVTSPNAARVVPVRLAAGADGQLYAAGIFFGQADFGVAVKTVSQPGLVPDGWLLGLSAATGAPGWVRTVTSAGFTAMPDLVAVPGGVVIGAKGTGAFEFGEGPRSSPQPLASHADALLARFDATGAHVWSKVVGGQNEDDVDRLIVAGDKLYVGGTTSKRFDLGGGVFLSTPAETSYLAQLDPATGAASWIVDSWDGGKLADVRNGKLLLAEGQGEVHLGLADPATGALLHTRELAVDVTAGPAVLVGGQAWLSLALPSPVTLDGLAEAGANRRWLVRVGL